MPLKRVDDNRVDCTTCGREYYDEPSDKDGDPCPTTEECPDYFEAKGLPPPSWV